MSTMSTISLRLIESTGDNGGELPPIERYEIWQRGRGLSTRTVTDTMLTLRRLQDATRYPLESTPTLAISRFLASEKFGARTRYTYYGHLRGFFRWLATDGGTDVMATLPAPRMPRSVPRPITTEQLRALLALRMWRTTRAAILLAAFAGMRVHEIAKVRGQDIDLDARTIYVIGKGGHGAPIPLHTLIIAIAKTMPQRGWWFPTMHVRPGQYTSREALSHTISLAMRRAGIPNGGAHRLRHWYGTNLVASGVDLRTTQTLMRHANLASTAIYTEVSDDRRVEAIDLLNL